VTLPRGDVLERIQAFAFSACTLDIRRIKVIMFNPLRSHARTQSDIAHEVSHLLQRRERSYGIVKRRGRSAADGLRVAAFRTCGEPPAVLSAAPRDAQPPMALLGLLEPLRCAERCAARPYDSVLASDHSSFGSVDTKSVGEVVWGSPDSSEGRLSGAGR
jgi:hypothetical protein